VSPGAHPSSYNSVATTFIQPSIYIHIYVNETRLRCAEININQSHDI
jgi:hypothetical protein